MRVTFRRLVRLQALSLSNSRSQKRLTRKPNRLRFECLEARSLLAACTSFTAGDLTIDGDGTDETITIASSGGNVTLNGSQLSCGGNPVAAANVDKLVVNGNGGNDYIDLIGVVPATFTHGGLATAGNVSVAAGDGDDSIFGSSFDDSLAGGNGKDLFTFGSGDDTLAGGANDDVYDFSDFIAGGANQTVDIVEAANADADFLQLGFVSNLTFSIDLSSTADQLIVTGLTLNLSASTAIENVQTSWSTGDHSVTGNDRNNVFYASSGATRTFAGGAGDDTYYVGGSSMTITEAANTGSDTIVFQTNLDVTLDLSDTTAQAVTTSTTLTLSSATGIENAWGGEGDDHLIGNTRNNWLKGDFESEEDSNDILEGGDGNDTLEGGVGDDELIGGDDGDTYRFSQLEIELATGEDIELGSDTLTETGSNDGDALDFFNYTSSVTVNLGSAVLQNIDGELSITLNDDDTFEHVIGSQVQNQITGNALGNILLGWAGADVIHGGGGADTIYGLGDADEIYGEDGNDTLYGGVGNDTLEGGNGNDRLEGDVGNDVMLGGADNDTLWGVGGNDSLDGGSGDDTYEYNVLGFAIDQGTDTISDSSGADTISFAGVGTATTFDMSDTTNTQTVFNGGSHFLAIRLGVGVVVENAVGSSYSDTITGNSVANSISGGDGDDVIYGGSGADTLVGGAGDDDLYGQAGADRLEGGTGSDWLEGGVGEVDTLNGGADSDTQKGGAGEDTLEDSIENYVS